MWLDFRLVTQALLCKGSTGFCRYSWPDGLKFVWERFKDDSPSSRANRFPPPPVPHQWETGTLWSDRTRVWVASPWNSSCVCHGLQCLTPACCIVCVKRAFVCWCQLERANLYKQCWQYSGDALFKQTRLILVRSDKVLKANLKRKSIHVSLKSPLVHSYCWKYLESWNGWESQNFTFRVACKLNHFHSRKIFTPPSSPDV